MRRRFPLRAAGRSRRPQRGQVLIIVAFLSTFLIMLLGLVIDSVRLYIIAAQAVRAAESGAVAGALYMPDFYSTASPDGNSAKTRACDAVKQNGVTACDVAAGQIGEMATQDPTNPYVLKVTVTMQSDVFFLAFVLPSLNTATISRTAAAQYLPPVTLGARTSYFGDQSTDDAPDPKNNVYLQNFWANINGPEEIKESGDAYNALYQEGYTDPQAHPDGGTFFMNRFPTLPTNNPQLPSAITNPDQQPNGFSGNGGRLGYNYQIYVPPGAGDVYVMIFNAAFGPGKSCTTHSTCDRFLPDASADPRYTLTHPHASGEYMQVTYSLYSSPLQFERGYDTLLTSYSPDSLDYYSLNGCSSGQPKDVVTGTCLGSIPDSSNHWHTFYKITNPGYYRFVVETGTTGYGNHNYGIKLTDKNGQLFSAASGVRIWGWNNMCVYFGAPNSTNIFDLGEIPAAYAGKTLHFSLFDPGDAAGSANVYMEILDPTGTAVKLPAWLRTDNNGTRLQATLNGDHQYNGDWIDIPVPIPPNYNPTPGNDWWQVRYKLSGGSPTDVITISIALSGSPIHLVQLLG